VKITSTIVNREDAILLLPDVAFSVAAVGDPGLAVGDPGVEVGAPDGMAVGASDVEVVSVISLSKKLSDAKVDEL
jgi:hypothetical protein|tara:strand:- start:284 stop:508 length:225 start_codon:yes stop_codon:yes gene_type:complete